MDALEAALVAAAALAGLTGTWSPCGFSMIETIGPTGHTGGLPTTVAACVTFAVGALIGGVITFGSMAVIGDAMHGADDRAAYIVAAAIALAAAVADARGTAIVPQVRRQLPEHWRRLFPMPAAAGLYGVLLGLGFTTFVLSFGVWALAGIAFAVGDPAVGLWVGLAFGAARALPVILIAPLGGRPVGVGLTALMAERPALYRGLRVGDGAALTLVAVALVSTAPAGAAKLVRSPAADPSTGDGELAFQHPDREGFLARHGDDIPLGGRDPALGGGRIAVARGDQIVLLSSGDLSQEGAFPAPGTDAIAVSHNWVAWRARSGNGDAVRARQIDNPQNPGDVKTLATASGASQLGRPSIDHNRVVFARASKRQNRIVKQVLGSGHRTTLMRSVHDGLSNPTIGGKHLLYVRNVHRHDLLKLARLGGGKGHTLLSRRGGTLWSTALGRKRAYVTLIHGTAPAQKIISAKR